jgi:hypothetical protein
MKKITAWIYRNSNVKLNESDYLLFLKLNTEKLAKYLRKEIKFIKTYYQYGNLVYMNMPKFQYEIK